MLGLNPMLINDPATLAAVTDAFHRYELALMANDIEALDRLFWPSEFTVRIGPGQNLYGIEAIQAFRVGRIGAVARGARSGTAGDPPVHRRSRTC